MSTNNPLSRDSFDYLARAAGLDPNDEHMEELYPYVQAALAANEGMGGLDTTGFEPDAAFNPAQFYQD